MYFNSEQLITSNFTWGEMIASRKLETYNKNHPDIPIDNTPDATQMASLRYLCEQFLQPLRDQFGPVYISSGFRSPKLNSLVGGAVDSWHIYGSAADIRLSSVLRGVQMISFIHKRFIDYGIGYDELILSKRNKSYWLHIAFNAMATPGKSISCYNGNRLRVSMMTYIR